MLRHSKEVPYNKIKNKNDLNIKYEVQSIRAELKKEDNDMELYFHCNTIF